MTLTDGAHRLAQRLRQRGCRTAIISGGFRQIAEDVKDLLGFDFCFSNQLVIKDGNFSGQVFGEIIDAKKKGEILCSLRAELSIPADRVRAARPSI